MSERNIERELASLLDRVAHLEAHSGESVVPPAIDRMTRRVEERMADEGLDPKVVTVGEVEPSILIKSRGATWSWEDTVRLEDMLAADPDALARSIAGLAHPVRIALAKALLLEKPRESSALLEIAGLNTTGQLYHHLQAMADVGLVERRGRNLWAGQNLQAFVLLMYAGYVLAEWRGPDPVEDSDDQETS